MGGDLGLVERARFDQVADGLGLSQVNAAVQKRAQGEFAGLGGAGALGERALDEIREHNGRAVTGDFNHILARIGLGPAEAGDHHLVEDAAGIGPGSDRGRLDELAERGPLSS